MSVTLEDGRCFAADDGDTLLAGALRAGIGFPHECSAGSCGACRFDLLDGNIVDRWPEAPGLSARDRARGKRLACQSVLNGDCKIRVRTSSEYIPIHTPKRQQMVLESVNCLNFDTREFSFRGTQPAEFLPGQYALLTLPEIVRPRPYSMSNLPNEEGLWQFIIRRVPDGLATNALFDILTPGDAITIDGPYGSAWLREDSPREIVCIAGGSGLGPMLSIARGALRSTKPVPIHFYYGARTAEDICGRTELEEMSSADGTTMKYRVALSNPTAKWSGQTGFIHELVENEIGPKLANCEFYFAGPPAMVNAVQEMLMVRHQVPFTQLHYDRFF